MLVDGAMGVFRDLSFHGNSADSAGALLVTSGSSLDWIGGQATENCARLVESGAVEISESETQAILVGVSVQGSVCRSPATCQERRDLAYRRYWCRNGVENLFDAEAVWPSAETCAELEPDDLRSHMMNYWHGRGSRWPRPRWSDFTSPASRALPDCANSVDKPHGVRVTGMPCTRFLCLCVVASLFSLSF